MFKVNERQNLDKQSTGQKKQDFKFRFIPRQRLNHLCWSKAGQLLHKQ